MPRKSKGKFKPHRISVMSNYGDAEIFRNSAAVLDDVDPRESLRYMKEIFKDKFDEDVIAMIFSECAYDVNQAYETLISLSSEDEPKQVTESSSQVLDAILKKENLSLKTHKAELSLTGGKAESDLSHPLTEDCSSKGSKLDAESSVITVAHGGQTYYLHQHAPTNEQPIASSTPHPKSPKWFPPLFFPPPGSSQSSSNDLYTDSFSTSSFSSPTPQFITPLMPTSSYKCVSPKELGPFESLERNHSPFSYSKIATKNGFDSNSKTLTPSRISSPNSKNNKQSDDFAISSAIEEIQAGNLVIIILRGLPGSGKSTLAKRLKFSGALFSTDDYFYNRGKYFFDATKLSEAHAWNRKRTLKALQKSITPIIIDNTNVEAWEFAPYVAMGKRHQYNVLILEPNTPWKFKVHDLSMRNKHGVSKEKITQMKERYQHNITVENIMKSLDFSNLLTEEPVENQFSFSKSKKKDEGNKNSFPSEALVHNSQEPLNLVLGSDPKAESPLSTKFIDKKVLGNATENPRPTFTFEDKTPNQSLEKKDGTGSNINDNVKHSVFSKGIDVKENPVSQVCPENKSVNNDNDNTPTSISNLDDLRALIREDSEDSQSLSTSNQDISSWKSITEPDEDFLWSTETENLENDDSTPGITVEPEKLEINDLSENVQNKSLVECDEKEKSVLLKKFSLESVEERIFKSESKVVKSASEISSQKRYPLFSSKVKDTNQDFSLDKKLEMQNCVKNIKTFPDEISKQLVKLNISDYDVNDIHAKQLSGNVNQLRSLKNSANTVSLDNEKYSKENLCLELELSIKRSLSLDHLNISESSTKVFNSKNSSHNPFEIKDKSILSSWEDINDEDDAKYFTEDSSTCIDINGNTSSPRNGKQVDAQSKNPKPQRYNHNLQFNFRKKINNEALNPLKIDDSVSLESNTSWENIEVKEINSEAIVPKEICPDPKPPRNMEVSGIEKKIMNHIIDSNINLDISSGKPLKNRLCANFNQSSNLFKNEWQFPDFISSDVVPLECEKENSLPHKLSYSSQTEPKDFVMVHKISAGEPVSTDYIILEAKFELDVNDKKPELAVHEKIVSQNPTFEKSTCTEDSFEHREVNEKMLHLQECFPDISEEDLLHLLEICHNDDTWLSNLLLEWGYKYNVKTPVQTPLKRKSACEETNKFDIKKIIPDEEISVEEDPTVKVVPGIDDNVVLDNAADNATNHAPFEKLTFVLDPVFASQLEELFGPVENQSQEKCSSAVDHVVEIDLNFAELIYNKWKKTTLSKGRSHSYVAELQNQVESSNVICRKPEKKDTITKERDSNEPLPLSEIMDMEYALQIHKKEKLQRDTDFSTKLKRLELYDLFPGADPLALDEIFEHNNFNLKDTVIALGQDIGQPKTEVQEKKIKKMDECLEKWRQNDVFREFALGDWSDWVFKENSLDSMEEMAFASTPSSMPPEAAELRDIATHHYHQRQECIKKAQAAYCRGMKDVASFYAQQGDEHGIKFKDANKMASDLISKQRSGGSSLVVDLHGLYVQEAIPILEKFLRDRKLELKRRQQSAPQIVSVITGQGIHSLHGPKILPSVISFLKKAGYGYNEINRGMLEVTLIPDC